MESQPRTYDFTGPFPSERDGPLETFLREQIVANAKIIYSSSNDGSGAPGRDFFVVIASADTNIRQAGNPQQLVQVGYRALLVERWWEWQEEGTGSSAVAKTLRRRVLKASSDGCSAPAQALIELAEAVFRETGAWLGDDEQEDLRREIDVLDAEKGAGELAQLELRRIQLELRRAQRELRRAQLELRSAMQEVAQAWAPGENVAESRDN
ncbi:hypothetical protein DIS24_g12200 [Lasiodiplodia hormozganensis]|uniref:Uncharacterized protein n=1 Tax=Lasiodiplodia hormozganensis TaxID=869390 RepID=A0AA39TGF5_9PEZI|nr:hypothetical protein DIS24_g12200 [Lasiodiplodia hormozganensis]